MNPNAHTLWRAPQWTLAALLAVLGMLGPFSIDTYIPAFTGIASALGATPVEMQQTLSAYLFGFAFMNLFHGALADSFGRRPVVLCGIAMFTLASAGCALSQSIGQLIAFRALQGLSTGAGIVVSRAVIRDMFPARAAGDEPSDDLLWHSPSHRSHRGRLAFCTCRLAQHLLVSDLRGCGALGRKLQAPARNIAGRASPAVQCAPSDAGYWQLGSSPRFVLLALASGVPFNGMFLYVLAAPAFLGEHLALAPTQFFWFFLLTISGIMGGAWLSGRLAGKIAPKRQIRHGFVIMFTVAVFNLGANLLFPVHAAWSLLPIAVFAFGWALMVPVVTLLVLDLHPERRGMASSMQAFVGSTANGIVAGILVPLVMHSTVLLAFASLLMMCVGMMAWIYLHHRWPDIGRTATPG